MNGTQEDKRIIGINYITTMNTFIDASYGVHPNMREHTGGTISFSICIMYMNASKQKNNAKRSTQYELISVSEYIPYSFWLGKSR